MSIWSDQKAAVALRLITNHGTVCSVERRVRGAMTASGDRADSSPPVPAFGVLLPGDGDVEVEGQKRRKGRILLSAISPEPSPEDLVTIQGMQVLVVTAKNFKPDGGLIYSDLEVAL